MQVQGRASVIPTQGDQIVEFPTLEKLLQRVQNIAELRKRHGLTKLSTVIFTGL